MTERDLLRQALWTNLKECTDLESAQTEIEMFMYEVDTPEGDEIGDAAWIWAQNAQQFATIH